VILVAIPTAGKVHVRVAPVAGPKGHGQPVMNWVDNHLRTRWARSWRRFLLMKTK
jgi:hypothetical protein